MTFALLAAVAVAGMTMASFGPAFAQNPKFLTLHAAETVTLDDVDKLCNMNYNVTQDDNPCPNMQGCYNKGGSYQPQQRYCTSNADTDCEYNAWGYNNFCYCNNNEDC